MKAIVKDTGKVVNVVSYHGAPEMWKNTENDNELYHTLELEFPDSDIPPERRMRYELAKAAMQGLEANTSEMVNTSGAKKIVEWSIQIADEMIKQLKESEVENESGNY